MWRRDASASGMCLPQSCKRRKLSICTSQTESSVHQQQERIKELEALNRQLVKCNAELNAELEAKKQQEVGGIIPMSVGQANPIGQACLEHKERNRFAMKTSTNAAAQMCSMSSGMLLHAFKSCAHAQKAYCLSPDNTQLFTAHQDGTSRMWDLNTGRCIRKYAEPKGKPTGVYVTVDMRYLITTVDNIANVWQVEDGSFIKSLQHQGCVRCICMAPDGRHFFSVEDDGLGRKFTIPGFDQVCLFDGKDDLGLYACCLPSDGKRFFAAADSGSVVMFDAELGGSPLMRFEGPGKATSVMTSPTAPLLFCGRDDASGSVVQMFSTETGKLQRTLRGHDRGVSAMWVTPDGRWLLTASWDGTARVWDVSYGTVFLTFCEHTRQV